MHNDHAIRSYLRAARYELQQAHDIARALSDGKHNQNTTSDPEAINKCISKLLVTPDGANRPHLHPVWTRRAHGTSGSTIQCDGADHAGSADHATAIQKYIILLPAKSFRAIRLSLLGASCGMAHGATCSSVHCTLHRTPTHTGPVAYHSQTNK